MHQVKVRKLIGEVESRVAKIEALGTADASAVTKELRAAWKALVDQLAVGPSPDTRICKKCNSEIMREATVCHHCWTKSAPTAAA
ncbi:hypothetical protein BH09MYX1_BH09MYX1_05680 [soil metagenome]